MGACSRFPPVAKELCGASFCAGQKTSSVLSHFKDDAGEPKILCWIAHIPRPFGTESGKFSDLLPEARAEVSYSDHLKLGF